MATAQGIGPFLKATLPARVLRRRGLSLHQRAPGSSPYDTRAGSHTLGKLTRNGRSQTAARGACNRPVVTSTPPSSPKPAVERADRHAGGVQPHCSGAPLRLRRIRHGGPYYVQETAPPLAPMPRLLDCGTSAATRGSPAHDPTVPIEHNDHGSVSRGGRRDGRYGQKWTSSNGGSRRAEAASNRLQARVPS